MNVWTNNTFEGHWLVPVAAVVIAETQERAAELLRVVLINKNLPGKVNVEDMILIKPNTETVIILSDGEY